MESAFTSPAGANLHPCLRRLLNMKKVALSSLDVAGKRVLIRVDFNVPQDKKDPSVITNTARCACAAPTATRHGASACGVNPSVPRPQHRRRHANNQLLPRKGRQVGCADVSPGPPRRCARPAAAARSPSRMLRVVRPHLTYLRPLCPQARPSPSSRWRRLRSLWRRSQVRR